MKRPRQRHPAFEVFSLVIALSFRADQMVEDERTSLYRRRAAELRAMAEQCKDFSLASECRRIAASFDDLADFVERSAKATTS